MRLARAAVVLGAVILMGCTAAAYATIRRERAAQTGPWHVDVSRRTLRTPDGPVSVLVWQPREAPGARPLILFASGWGERVDPGSRQLADLASHGYVVVGFDDVAFDPARPHESAQDIDARHAPYAYDTPAAYAATFKPAGRKVAMAARKGKAVLDAALVAPDLAARIDAARIGFLGFSFGGATGVEQSLSDARIRAVVNLDGWLFGEATHVPIDRPYLLFYIDDDFPPDRWLASDDPAERALALGCAFDRSLHRSLLGRADFFWLHARHVTHEELAGAAPSWQWRRPFAAFGEERAALRQRQLVHTAIIRAFFDRYLLGHATAFPPADLGHAGDVMTISDPARAAAMPERSGAQATELSVAR
ncbi:MAG: hypothetical protein KGJ57_18885 [Sphingomonadales bacterium]|nr:hypothetical protein [Sphingomonadales bacterium]MDE2171463.1 hypothetical protein [Sphingomonadales bacterium]